MRAEMFPDAVRHLGGEPLLHLQAAGKAVQHARQLGYADHPVARKIGDMRLADDRRQVMLAVRLEGNVLQKHDLVIAAHLAEGAARSEEHTSELQSLMRISYAVFCLKKKKYNI